ncbi:MAG: bifunctional adenosylcobinamide kinase/adenosylcobinamide-phosphate guanylyltransferase [Lachnospiraceae bacterium]|nr:bifunctional adenosylcobinamide kinase/adenosylcobinamide-phosphate guanylyltransferase [Lachnospiraceae bacterium]
MLILVTGGAASGKSEYAERLAVEHPGAKLWYAATMLHDPDDRETTLRIEKHRQRRAGAGFETIELPCGIERLIDIVHPGDTVLLEDLSNLLANEMFMPGRPAFREETITAPLLRLHAEGVTVIIVGNRTAEDLPPDAGPEISRYVTKLQKIQQELAASADRVAELVCGIPLTIRGNR